MIVSGVAFAFEPNDVSSHKELLHREMHAYLFIAAADDLHRHFAGRQIDLDVQFAVLTDEVLFVHSN